MCLRHNHCNWAEHSATITAEGGEGSSLASTAATADKVTNIVTLIAVAATTVADKSCARAAAANDMAASPYKVEQAGIGLDKIEQTMVGPHVSLLVEGKVIPK